jgi:hypothetical protein
MESITILGDPAATSSATAPLLKPKFDKIPGETYTVMVTDNLNGDPKTGFLTSNPSDTEHFVAPILRIWSKGYLVTLPQPYPLSTDPNYYGVKLENDKSCTISKTDTNYDWWKVIDITGLTPSVTVYNTCGDGSAPSFFPYGVTP